MRKPTPYVSLHDVVAFDFVDGDVPFDDLVDGEGLCCPDDPFEEVMRCLSAVDDPFLAAFKLDCSPPTPAADADVDSRSEEHMHADVGGGLDLQRARRRKCGEEKRCGHCQTTETPQWRVGPDGPSTLCNACGIRYRIDHLLPEYRPSTSPGFGSDGYSNRHRKVVKLREKKRKKAMLAATATALTSGPV
ncbi:hypothetical protein OsJ_09286 [Oryza sativa Japonica Group]|uniref:GATA-type domain-containing protein n=1 Tax=Oryza sativa subsp. japonica TaxID=39947 RepID=B9FAX1_ORYSJ|nr:hypothetical protein OsJ_09286 [Oryza sativa Japonica Group]